MHLDDACATGGAVEPFYTLQQGDNKPLQMGTSEEMLTEALLESDSSG